MPGLTAYFGMLEIGKPQPGETVVVSAAAGAVGSSAGQIAKLNGCRAVGIAGSEEKVRHVVEDLGFAAAMNHAATPDYTAKLEELCPAGIDVYFDNVGGRISDAVLGLINTGARVVVCGQVSQYNLKQPEWGPRWLLTLVEKQARVEGFLVGRFAARNPEGLYYLTTWVRAGLLKYRETMEYGLENAPRAFIGMLEGRNVGKQLVKVE
jgi:NADPH-dependent curcumin reductase CurA